MDNNQENIQSPNQATPVQQPVAEPVAPTPNPEPAQAAIPATPAQEQPSDQPIIQPAQPTQPTPSVSNLEQNRTMSTQYSMSIKNILIAIASALGAIFFFLPWVTASSFGINFSANATEITNGYKYIGYAILILFVILSTITTMKATTKLSKILKICISVIGGIATLLSIIMIIIIFNDLNGYGSAGIGLWLCAIAGAVSSALPWIPINNE